MNDCISRQWLMECVNEGWIKFETEKDENIFIHLVRDIAPPAQSRIVYCKDCKKHNVEYGYTDEICPLISLRGKAKEHEFDYQFCIYGKRKPE